MYSFIPCIFYTDVFPQNEVDAYRVKTWSVRGLLEKYPTFGREKETGLLGALDT